MLKQRILTALVIGPAAILAIFYLPLNYFALFLLAVVSIGAWEWGPFMGLTTTIKRLAFVATTVVFIAGLWWQVPLSNFWLEHFVVNDVIVYLLWGSVSWWAVAAILMLLYPKLTNTWSSNCALKAAFGWLTLIPTWAAFVLIRSHDYAVDSYQGAQLIMFLFLIVWSADIGAYFVGKSMGKNKLMPNVSPGKTFEGFLGGVVCACVLTSVAGYFMYFSTAQMLTALGVTAVISVVSVLGDLSESMFKREAGIKDSGSILPGHGGILDRIDSLTATAPIFALCYISFGW
ncbi:MAG: phosphatidate cytidylyltransferase [Colwellia sp.]